MICMKGTPSLLTFELDQWLSSYYFGEPEVKNISEDSQLKSSARLGSSFLNGMAGSPAPGVILTRWISKKLWEIRHHFINDTRLNGSACLKTQINHLRWLWGSLASFLFKPLVILSLFAGFNPQSNKCVSGVKWDWSDWDDLPMCFGSDGKAEPVHDDRRNWVTKTKCTIFK